MAVAAKFGKQYAIGFDLGHSAAKIRFSELGSSEYQELTYSTLVIPAVKLADAATAHAAKDDTVSWDGREYFVGATAEAQGRHQTFSGMSNDWIQTVEHDVLFAAGLDKVERILGGQLNGSFITVGLPSETFPTQRQTLRTRLLSALAQRGTPNNDIRVQAQPYGPLHVIGLAADGESSPRNMREEIWGVIEIGHQTTDYLVSKRLSIVESARDSDVGCVHIYNHLAQLLKTDGIAATPERITRAVMHRKLMHFGKELDVGPQVDDAIAQLAAVVKAGAQARFQSLVQEMDGIILAGGGAPLLASALAEIYPHITLFDDPIPRMAVAEGFRRFSLMYAKTCKGVISKAA